VERIERKRRDPEKKVLIDPSIRRENESIDDYMNRIVMNMDKENRKTKRKSNKRGVQMV
jgi:hypothetical protein